MYALVKKTGLRGALVVSVFWSMGHGMEVPNQKKVSPLHHACAQGDSVMVEFLLGQDDIPMLKNLSEN